MGSQLPTKAMEKAWQHLIQKHLPQPWACLYIERDFVYRLRKIDEFFCLFMREHSRA